MFGEDPRQLMANRLRENSRFPDRRVDPNTGVVVACLDYGPEFVDYSNTVSQPPQDIDRLDTQTGLQQFEQQNNNTEEAKQAAEAQKRSADRLRKIQWLQQKGYL